MIEQLIGEVGRQAANKNSFLEHYKNRNHH